MIFTFEFRSFDWLSQLYSEWWQTSKLVNLKVSDKLRVCDFGQNLKMTQSSQFCSIHEENKCKSSLHSNFIILTDFHSFTVNEQKLKISQFSSLLLRSWYTILLKIWKWLKVINSVPFIKKTLVNQVYIRIWSF